MAEITVRTSSADDTRALAAAVARLLRPGDLVALTGPLGAGKTCFVQGLARGLGVRGPVTSPTFVVIRLHSGPTPLCHVDAYRLRDGQELIELGLDDLLEEAVVAVEWAEGVTAALPDGRLDVMLQYCGDGRELRLRGLGARMTRVVEQLCEERAP
ncbi:MAG TPA: tRNA (adenosine(37)-N6)-threonylcarbamoyltransferase complex ATPase subunit type 1 TsaE [Armatimonadota bacterium]|nr:tRNA (adenosine(37)-N6)-threonylcarbamoyltransferase complex ATPase subunit type 1 TsaE [Armatimonadota bacterium]